MLPVHVSDSRHICTFLQIFYYILSESEMRSVFYLCESPKMAVVGRYFSDGDVSNGAQY